MITVTFQVDENEQLYYKVWAFLVRSRGRCERCETTEGKLQAHHKDRNKSNTCLANGECLCRWCHEDEHHGSFSKKEKKLRNMSTIARRARGIRAVGTRHGWGEDRIQARIQEMESEYVTRKM